MKDSLWSLDLVRCESVALRTFWVLVVMDQWTRRIVGFGIQPGIVDGPTLCRMFKQAIRGSDVPKYLSSDHDPSLRTVQELLGHRDITTTMRYAHFAPNHATRNILAVHRAEMEELSRKPVAIGDK